MPESSPITNCPYNQGLAWNVHRMLSVAEVLEADQRQLGALAATDQVELTKAGNAQAEEILYRAFIGEERDDGKIERTFAGVDGLLYLAREGNMEASTKLRKLFGSAADIHRQFVPMYEALMGMHDIAQHRYPGERCESQGLAPKPSVARRIMHFVIGE